MAQLDIKSVLWNDRRNRLYGQTKPRMYLVSTDLDCFLQVEDLPSELGNLLRELQDLVVLGRQLLPVQRIKHMRDRKRER